MNAQIGVNCTAARASAPHQTEGARRRRENFWSFYAFTLNFASPTSSSGSAAPHVTTRSTCSATRRTHSCTLRAFAVKDPAKTTHRISALPSRNPAARLHSFAYASARASALPAPPRARLVPCLIDAAASTPPRDTHGAGRPRRAASAQPLLCLRRLPLHWMAQQRADCWLDAGSVQICSSTGEWPVPVNNEMGKQTEENEVRRPEAGGCCSARGGLSSLSRQGALTSCVSRFAHSSWAA